MILSYTGLSGDISERLTAVSAGVLTRTGEKSGAWFVLQMS